MRDGEKRKGMRDEEKRMDQERERKGGRGE